MSRPIVACLHRPEQLSRFYPEEDLARLQERVDWRVLGSNRLEELRNQLTEVEILTSSWGMARLNADFLAAAPALRAVCYAAGSVKGFVTDEAFERGIVITSSWLANAIPVAEVSVALITLANKRWFQCQDALRDGGPEHRAALSQDGHPGNYGTAVGLIGFGAIGREVARRLMTMELEVLVYDPYVDPAAVTALGGRLVRDLHELAARCQVLSLHAPNIPACRHMCDAALFAAMPEGATFINTARGALVDEEALVAELQRGRIFAMLDVTDPEPPPAGHPFYTLPNCWLTPHRAGSSGAEVRRMGSWAIAEILRLVDGEEPRHRVRREMLAQMA